MYSSIRSSFHQDSEAHHKGQHSPVKAKATSSARILPFLIKSLVRISSHALVSLDLHEYPFNYRIHSLIPHTRSWERAGAVSLICFTDGISLQFTFIKSAHVWLLSQSHYLHLLI